MGSGDIGAGSTSDAGDNGSGDNGSGARSSGAIDAVTLVTSAAAGRGCSEGPFLPFFLPPRRLRPLLPVVCCSGIGDACAAGAECYCRPVWVALCTRWHR